jgi:hypothetical protein
VKVTALVGGERYGVAMEDHWRARRHQQAVVAIGLLEVSVSALELQSERLDDSYTDNVSKTTATRRIVDAHFFLVAARNVWRALELAAAAGSERAGEELGRLRRHAHIAKMRSTLEHLDKRWADYEPDDTILEVSSRRGSAKPILVMSHGEIAVEVLTGRLREAVDRVRGDLAIILGDVLHTSRE